MEDKITITKVEFITLKRLYKIAQRNNKEKFLFKGREVLTDYAKYLIQYLEDKF